MLFEKWMNSKRQNEENFAEPAESCAKEKQTFEYRSEKEKQKQRRNEDET